jgi:hypothetical protein
MNRQAVNMLRHPERRRTSGGAKDLARIFPDFERKASQETSE